MAITKSVDKKAAPKKGAGKSAVQDPAEVLAEEVLVTLLHRAIVRLGEPARIGEIIREVGDDSITPALARHIFEAHPRRFAAVDRRWDVAQRYLDKKVPVSRTIQELVAIYGGPIPVSQLAGELGFIYGRVREHFEQTAPRMLIDSKYFSVNNGDAFGLRSWLLDTSADRDDDVLFYNYLTPAALEPFAAADALDWASDPLQAARELIVMGQGEPVDNRVVQWYARRGLGEDFDAATMYALIYNESAEFIPLQSHRWIIADSVDSARTYWSELAAGLGEFVEDAPAAEPIVEAPVAPLEVSESDHAELLKFVSGREDFFTVGELLSNVFDIMPNSRTYEIDKVTLGAYVKQHEDEFTWVGTDRYQAQGTLPPYLGQLPESLTFPQLPRFETADGEILDQMLADSAFEDALAEEMQYSVAQDVSDQEDSAGTRWPDGVAPEAASIRLVLKAHHKEIGTFPLAQIPYGFLPTGPEIVVMTVVDAAGNSYPVYVDYNVQLIYGLFDVYAEITAESGAVFHLEKTDDPAVYKFVNSNETDAGVFVSPHRYEELTDYRAEVEAGPVSTYDIIRRILDHYRKGCSYLTLLTEVNIVRRTPRRLVASVLSGYTAFHERANRWAFDAKKEPEGFDRRKAPFIVKR